MTQQLKAHAALQKLCQVQFPVSMLDSTQPPITETRGLTDNLFQTLRDSGFIVP